MATAVVGLARYARVGGRLDMLGVFSSFGTLIVMETAPPLRNVLSTLYRENVARPRISIQDDIKK